MRNKRRPIKAQQELGRNPPLAIVSRRMVSDERLGNMLPLAALAMVGALIPIAFLIPADARSVFSGDALAQNLGWMVAALLTVLAAKFNGWAITSRYAWLVALAAAWLAASCFAADRFGNGRLAWNGFWQIISLGLCYWTVRVLGRSAWFQRAVVVLILTCCVGESILGMHQLLLGFKRVQWQYVEDREGMLRRNGIEAPEGSVQRKRFESRLLYSYEPFATFALSNSLATTLGAAVVLGCGLVLPSWLSRWHKSDGPPVESGPPNEATAGAPAVARSGRSDRTGKCISESKLRLSIASMAVAVIVCCFVLTKSRSGLIAVVVSMALWLSLDRPWNINAVVRRWAMRGIGATVIATAAIGFWLVNSGRLVLSDAVKSFAFRVDYWRATWSMIQDHPWLGVGLGNFQSYYPKYKLPQASEIIADPHNWILDLAATVSVPLALLCALWVLFSILPYYTWLAGVRGRKRTIVDAAAASAPEIQSDKSHEIAVDSELRERKRDLRWMSWGVAVGSLVCCAMMTLTGQALDLDAMFLMWIGAAVFLWAMLGWIHDGSMSLNLLRSASLAMIVALFASGSWQASGIAVPLVCLLATVQCDREKLHQVTRQTTSGWASWTAPSVIGLCLLVFLVQTWRPVSASWTLFQQSGRARSYQEQLELMRQAAKADTLDAGPLIGVCQLLNQQISAAQFSSELGNLADSLDLAIKEMLNSDSAGQLNWQLAGDAMLSLAGARRRLSVGQDGEIESLEKAREFYSEAIARYPGSVQLHVEMAVVDACLGRWDSTLRFVHSAHEWDQQAMNDDQKLVNQLIWLPYVPERILDAAVVRPSFRSPWAQAEPLVNWMRTYKNAQTPEQ